MKKKLIRTPCGVLALILVLCLVTLVFSADFRNKAIIITSETKDLIHSAITGDSTCNGLFNLADQSTLEKEYDSIKDAINNYPWNMQYLPVADVYCKVPWSIASTEITKGPTRNHLNQNAYSVRVSIKDSDGYTYGPVATVTFNPQTNKYKVTSVKWLRV